MEWEFRKTLQSIESYREESQRFIAEIQKGTQGVLKTIVREIQLIITDPNALIISKVQALRFTKEIMVLGKQDVISQVKKLVPHLLKICSFRLESDDINRGEKYFYDHPQYLQATPRQKQNIQIYGSTYFTFSLQSIYNWADWIKVDENGNESLYSKGYHTLLERGVKFHKNFTYYKKTDTERFNNTYKIEFFEDNSSDFESSVAGSSARSEKNSDVSLRSREYQSIQSVKNAISNYQHAPGNQKKVEKFQLIKKSVVSLLERRYPPNKAFYGKDKSDKKWLQSYIIHYNSFVERKIPFEEFMKRVATEVIEIPEKSQYEEIGQKTISSKRYKTSAKQQFILKTSDKRGQESPKRQEAEMVEGKNRYKEQVKLLSQQLQQQRAKFEDQKKSIIEDYQERLKNLKKQYSSSNSNKNEYFIKENDRLKDRISELQKSIKISRLKQVQYENNFKQSQLLKQQNNQIRNKYKQEIEKNEYNQQLIKRLQKEIERKNNESGPGKELNAKNKQLTNLQDELHLYKNTLKNERDDYSKKIKAIENQKREIEKQLSELKEKNKQLNKRVDLKDLEVMQLNEQVKLFRNLNKDEDRSQYEKSNAMPYNYLSKTQKTPLKSRADPKAPTTFEHKKYEQIKNKLFQNEKEKFIRFCRSALKKKQLILKQNQIQVGIITEKATKNQYQFSLHITNTSSEDQVNEIKFNVDIANPSVYEGGVDTDYIFCLLQNEQEKIKLKCRNTNSFNSSIYDPFYLKMSYIKRGKIFQTKILIPFVLYKLIDIVEVDPSFQINAQQESNVSFEYSQKMIIQKKSLYSYFPEIREVSNNKYESDLTFKHMKNRLRLMITIGSQNKITISLYPTGEAKGSKQMQIIKQDLLSFFELCFKR